MLKELQVTEVVEEVLGDDLEHELDMAFERAGGENADMSKIFLDSDAEG